MKKLLLSAGAVFLTYAVNAQQTTGNSNYNDFNHWSIDLQGGVNKPTVPLTSGYSVKNANFWQADAGVRYMINEKFGLKADFGYDRFKGNSNSLPFESHMYRGQLEGVVNLGNILGFRDWTQTINILGHAGVGYGRLDGDNFAKADNLGFVTAGLTPQVRLTNNLALTADVSVFGNAWQDTTFDGNTPAPRRGFNGYFLNGSVGLTYYIGSSSKKHADWYSRENTEQARIDSLQDQLNSHIEDFNNEKEKVAALQQKVDNFQPTTENSGVSSDQYFRDLINGNYISVLFPFNQSQPQQYSMESINFVVSYMKAHPNANVDVLGYADAIGSSSYNQKLSQRRADTVKNIMISSGIDSSRLNAKGMGIDNSVNINSQDARQLVRRVVFKLD